MTGTLCFVQFHVWHCLSAHVEAIVIRSKCTKDFAISPFSSKTCKCKSHSLAQEVSYEPAEHAQLTSTSAVHAPPEHEALVGHEASVTGRNTGNIAMKNEPTVHAQKICLLLKQKFVCFCRPCCKQGCV